MKKLFFIFIFLALAFSWPVSADNTRGDVGPQVYIFHLWYADGKLTEDRNFNFPFDQVYEEYKAVPATGSHYSGKIVSIKGETLSTFYFTLGALASRKSGKLSVKTPHFFNAKTVFFYDQSGKELLSIDLAPFGPICDEDKTCEVDVGENAKTCPSDCQSEIPDNSAAVPSGNAAEKDSSLPPPPFYRYLPLIIGGGIIVVSLVIWAVLRHRKRNASSTL